MTVIKIRYFCDGCGKERTEEELQRVQVNVWRRDSRGVYLDPQFRMFCARCKTERAVS